MDALQPDTGGRWLVTTQGSTHVWDLDNMTYERRPGPESKSGSFDNDGTPMKITRVERWPAVGDRSFVWYDNPEFGDIIEEYRISSRIEKIESLDTTP